MEEKFGQMNQKIKTKDHSNGGYSAIMKIIKDNKFTLLLDEFTFYDFEEFVSRNNYDIKIQFKDEISSIVYGDLSFDDNWNLYEKKENMIVELVDLIINRLEENCIATKYNNRWVVDRKKSNRLFKMLKNNHVKMIATRGLLLQNDTEEMSLFIKSILKYNSFVQFLLKDTKLVMTVTDHMDIFLSGENDNFIKTIENIVMHYNEESSSIFELIR